MNIVIADTALSQRDALDLLRRYPRKTLERYDARAPGPARNWRQFTAEDIAAARVIEPRVISRAAVRAGLLGAELPWRDVPPRTVDIADVHPGSKAYTQLSRFYIALLNIHGVGQAVASKMMYLRWPATTPIFDGVLDALYKERAKAKFRELRDAGRLPEVVREQPWTRLFFFAFREDVLANRDSGALSDLREHLEHDSGFGRRIALVSDCRLLDMLAWGAAR